VDSKTSDIDQSLVSVLSRKEWDWIISYVFTVKIEQSIGARQTMYGTHIRFVSAEVEEEDIVWDRHNSLWPMTKFQATPGRRWTAGSGHERAT